MARLATWFAYRVRLPGSPIGFACLVCLSGSHIGFATTGFTYLFCLSVLPVGFAPVGFAYQDSRLHRVRLSVLPTWFALSGSPVGFAYLF